VEFCQRYSRHFVQQGMNSVGHARHYLSGLLGTQRRKNIETIHNDVAQSDYQGMEQFISSSPWCHRGLMDQLALDADQTLGDASRTGLFLDESGFLKKGKASVGVQRQWSGRAGKVENCQVGVFACLGRDEHMVLRGAQIAGNRVSWISQ
jgi:SRSO17 transposase